MAAAWKQILGTVAPLLGNAVGGPMGGMAMSLIAEKLGLEPDATDKQVHRAIENMPPEDYAKIKAAELDLKARLKELDIEEERIHAKDRASARSSNLASGRWTADILAFIVTFGFLGALVAFFFAGLELSATVKDPLLILIGVLGASFKDVMQYFFGSSRGSKEKTRLMNGRQ